MHTTHGLHKCTTPSPWATPTIVSNIIKALLTYHLGEILGNTLASWWAHIGNKEIISIIQQHPFSPKEKSGPNSVLYTFFYYYYYYYYCDVVPEVDHP
jgi:hypothetical protein